MGSLLVAAAAVLWGLWPIWIRHSAGGAVVAAVAYGGAGLVGIPLAIWEGRGRHRPARAWILIGALGLADAGNALFYFRAVAEGAVAPAVLTHYLAPVLIALAAPRFLGEPRAPSTPLALGLALAGTALLVFAAPSAGGAVSPALLLGSASAVFYAIVVLLSKKLAPHFGNAELLVWHLLVAGAVLVAAAWPLGPPSTLVWPAVGCLVSTLLPGLIYFAGLRRIAAEKAAILAYLEPLVAVVAGWLAFGETPAPAALAGGLLIVAGGALVVTRPGGVS